MGLKPRPDEPFELTMQAHGAGFSREATISLRTGHCAAIVSSFNWHGGKSERVSRNLELTIPSLQLAPLRATAKAILAAGDTHYREQFAQMGVSFRARSQRRTATADFEIDVGAGTPYDRAWDLVLRNVNHAIEPG